MKRTSEHAKQKHKQKSKEKRQRISRERKEAAESSGDGNIVQVADSARAGDCPSRKKLCWRFRKGSCKFGDACQYQHFPVDSSAGDLCPLTLAQAGSKASERLDLTVDSGAAVHALPREAAKDYPTEKGPDKSYTAASGHQVPVLGKRVPVLQFQDSTKGVVEFEVMDVSKALLSVSRALKSGYQVVFDSEENGGSYMIHKEKGHWYRLHERNGVYVMPTWARPFSRQADGLLNRSSTLCPLAGGAGSSGAAASASGGDLGMDAANATAEEYSCCPCGEEVQQQQQQEAAEETPSKALAAPVQPTELMIEDHRASGHRPCRSWCPACVRGRGRSYSHIQRDKSEEVVTTISIDYGFFGSEESPDKENPVLVVKDRRSKALWAHLVPSKGVENPHGYRSPVKDLNSTGYKKTSWSQTMSLPSEALLQKQPKSGMEK